MIVAPGVTTFGELEVIKFINEQVKTSQGILVDARTPSWHAKGTIPGSVNVPFTTFALDRNDKKLIAAMKKFGVARRKTAATGYWTDLKDILGIEKNRTLSGTSVLPRNYYYGVTACGAGSLPVLYKACLNSATLQTNFTTIVMVCRHGKFWV